MPGLSEAADFPAPKEADWIARDFRFHTGEVLPELRLHYTTIGEPTGQPVLVLHGTTQSGTSMLSPAFAGELFGPGQPLDAAKYFLILPDSLGHGKSSKPSDGLKAQFPQYDYNDMVAAQYRLVTEGLGIAHLRLVIGNSMGGMNAWMWSERYPNFMDVLVPMASQPAEMSGRNWMLRRLITDGIRTDPEWKNGNYSTQPRSAQLVSVFYNLATNGGTLGLQKQGASHAEADKLVSSRLGAKFSADANDVLYQWDASRSYSPGTLEAIKASVLAINSADDERNPPETGIMESALKRMETARLYLIPGSPDTYGHGTTFYAKFWKTELKTLLDKAPVRATPN